MRSGWCRDDGVARRDSLFVTHGGPDSDRGNEIEISNGSASRPVQETLAASEVIVLETGERTAVSDEPSIWAEWAPDGSALAVLQPVSQGARWLIADERRLRELGTMQATPTFLRNYLFFSWQYVESPRIWAPTPTRSSTQPWKPNSRDLRPPTHWRAGACQ